MDHRTTHGEHCECHSCKPANRWDIPASRGGNPGTPEREAYIRARQPDGPAITLTEAWCGPRWNVRPRPGQYSHLT